MRIPAQAFWRLIGAIVVAGVARAAPAPLTADPLTAVEPAPELVRFATTAGFPLRDIDVASPAESLVLGQSATLLVTLQKESGEEQWLIRLTIEAMPESERTRPLPPDDVIHTSTGRTLRYAHSRAAVGVELVGPFSGAANGRHIPAVTRKAHTVVNANYLTAGIARYCQSGIDIARRIEAAGVKNPIYFAGSGIPPAEAVVKGRRFADSIRLTEDEERAAFSVYFSLTTFFGAAMEIPAVRSLLEEIVAKPSAWSVIRQLGVRTDFDFFWTGARAIEAGRAAVDVPVYELPVQVFLNGQRGVKATIAVTTPSGPLATCAGILAVCAEHPTNPARRLFIRVLAAGPKR
jgi:hypothetical protein